MAAADRPVTLAAIAGAHGVRGEVRLKLFGEGAEALRAFSVFDAGARKLVVCGGGEPLDEPDFITGAVSARLGGAPVARPVARNVIGGGLALAFTFAIGHLVGGAIG